MSGVGMQDGNVTAAGVTAKRARLGTMEFADGAITGVASIDGLPYPPSASLPQFLPANGFMASTGLAPPNPVLQATNILIGEVNTGPIQNQFRGLEFDVPLNAAIALKGPASANPGFEQQVIGNLDARRAVEHSKLDGIVKIHTDENNTTSTVLQDTIGVKLKAVNEGLRETSILVSKERSIIKLALGEYINTDYRQAFPSIHRYTVRVYNPEFVGDGPPSLPWPGVPGDYTPYPPPGDGSAAAVNGQLILSDRCNPPGARPPTLPTSLLQLGFPIRWAEQRVFTDSTANFPLNSAIRGAALDDVEAVSLVENGFVLSLNRAGYYRISYNLTHFFNGGDNLDVVAPVVDTGDDSIVVQLLPFMNGATSSPLFDSPPVMATFGTTANTWPWLTTISSKLGSSSGSTKIYVPAASLPYLMMMKVYINWKQTIGPVDVATCCNVNLPSCIEVDYMGDDTAPFVI